MLNYLIESMIHVDDDVLDDITSSLNDYIRSFLLVNLGATANPFNIDHADIIQCHKDMKGHVHIGKFKIKNKMFSTEHEFDVHIINNIQSIAGIDNSYENIFISLTNLWHTDFGGKRLPPEYRDNKEIILYYYDNFLQEIRDALEHELVHVLEKPKNIKKPSSQIYNATYNTSEIEFSPLLTTNIRKIDQAIRQLANEYKLSSNDKKKIVLKMVGADKNGGKDETGSVTEYVPPLVFFTDLKKKKPDQWKRAVKSVIKHYDI